MHLLQLVGNQVWPNLLPILAWNPSKVSFLTSADPEGGYARAIENLIKAAAMLDIHFADSSLATQETDPTFRDCTETLARISATDIDLVNLTGGMKSMSIAAYEFAQKNSIPAFYLDTRRKAPWEDYHTAPFREKFPDLGQVAEKITVKAALAAQGFPVPKEFKSPQQSELEFGARAAAIRADREADAEIANELAKLRATFHPTRSFLKNRKLRAALGCSIQASPETPWFRYLLAAAHNGIVFQGSPENEFFLTSLDPITAGSDELRSRAEHNFKLLEGLWFELAVLQRLKAQSAFSDVQWSVEADADATSNADFRGETDLVAFNSRTLNLHFISCKTSGPYGPALDHIQGLRRRATKEGGKFSKAELWIFAPKDERSKQSLENHCLEQGVDFHVFTNPKP